MLQGHSTWSRARRSGAFTWHAGGLSFFAAFAPIKDLPESGRRLEVLQKGIMRGLSCGCCALLTDMKLRKSKSGVCRVAGGSRELYLLWSFAKPHMFHVPEACGELRQNEASTNIGCMCPKSR